MDAAQVVAIFLGIWWVVAAWILTFYWSDGNHLSVSRNWKQTSNGSVPKPQIPSPKPNPSS